MRAELARSVARPGPKWQVHPLPPAQAPVQEQMVVDVFGSPDQLDGSPHQLDVDGCEARLREHLHEVVTPDQRWLVPGVELMPTVTYRCRDQPGHRYLAG